MANKKKYKAEFIRIFIVAMYYPFEVSEEYVIKKDLNERFNLNSSENSVHNSVFRDEIKAKMKSLAMLKEFYERSFKTAAPKRVKLYKVTKELDALIEKYPEKII